ncbi:MAG: glycosyltransferase family 4 protein [Deltaproteobacteria bacterium]|nr:MAG: glycosyltransferase family 4 protein [Deltaproteobacteria bacterium]
MKTLFISDVALSNPTSGSEQMLNHQAIGLASEGIQVYAITRTADKIPASITNVDGVVEGSYCGCPQAMFRFFFALLKYPVKFYNHFVQDGPFQVLICHQPFNFFALLLRKRIGKLPLLYNFHSPSHQEYLLSHQKKGHLSIFFPATVRRLIEKICLTRAMKIMVESRYMKQKVQAIHRIPADKILVNPGGVDLDRFTPYLKRNQLKEKLGFPRSKIHLLTVRNLEPRMGLDNLLKCMVALKKNGLPVYLTLGGEGGQRKELEKLIVNFGLNKEVSITGFIPPDVLPKYYAASDFFILPTRHLEGFGLVTPESMACGTPVLGTPVGATREILSGLDDRFLFKDATSEAMARGIQAAIQNYLNNKKKYDELRMRCRAFAEKHYSWNRHVCQLRSIVRDLQAESIEY